VRAIAERLKAKLTQQNEDQLVSAKPVNPRAYETYLQAHQFLMKYEFKKAEDCYRRAVAIDSTLAAAWAGLANVYATEVLFSEISPAQAKPLAEAALWKAVGLDDQLAETQAALGTIRLNFDWDWSGADAATKRAVELNPNSIEVLIQRRMFLYDANRGEEAIEIQRRICDMLPEDPDARDIMGWVLFYARHYDDAIAQFRKNDEMAGQRGQPNSMVAMCYYMKGMHKEALAECDANPHPGMIEMFIYAKLGKREKPTAALADAKRQWEPGKSGNPLSLAVLSAGLGNKDEAFAWIRKGLEDRWPEMLQFPTEPYYDDLRGDPRWQELLDLIHYPKSKS
jgi:tetratricopeptide (TPR) repeat protein